MHDTIIRYAELALKGGNRQRFEQRLVENIRSCLKSHGTAFSAISRKRNRIVVRSSGPCSGLSRVFGIASYSYAVSTSQDNIRSGIDSVLEGKSFSTFRITVRSPDGSLSSPTQEMNALFGSYVAERYQKKVSLKAYDLEIGIEIIHGHAYVFTERIAGPGGLPYGVNGSAYAIINDRKSLLAAWMMMKRGVRVIPVAEPGTDISLLGRYSYGTRMAAVAPEKMRPTFLITGETLEDRPGRRQGFLLLQPLVGLSRPEIEARLKNL